MLNPIICRSRPVKRTCPARRAPSPPARPQAAHSAPTVRSAAPEWLGRVLTVSMSLHVSGLPLVIGGSLVSYSVDAALIFAALASVIAAIATFLLIPREPNFKAERG